MTRRLPYPIFDIDNHMYETRDALLKYLPKQHKGKVGYVEVNGRPKLVVKDHISHMIPNPTFERVARPGSAEDYSETTPKGSIFASSSATQWMSSPPTSHLAPARADGRAGHRPVRDVSDARQPHRGAHH